ncbi:phosphoribosyltransferase family protein [Prolixibacteraceae bacterium]|nr:phosphoribosyltransferase family protein [Prolixibacteraceae bacterium]
MNPNFIYLYPLDSKHKYHTMFPRYRESKRGNHKRWWSIFRPLVHILAPQYCLYCHQQIFNDIGLCRTCWMNIQWVNCIQMEYRDIELTQIMPITHLYCLTPYHNEEHVPILIHHLKYSNRKDVGKYLGRLLGEKVFETWATFSWDVIVPVPLHYMKRWRRGYNQSEFIALGMAEVLRIPLIKDAIKRVRYTKTQTTLDKGKRKKNMHEAFRINNASLLQYRRILIVDDVCTTGATMLAIIEEVSQLKGVEVGVVTISST